MNYYWVRDVVMGLPLCASADRMNVVQAIASFNKNVSPNITLDYTLDKEDWVHYSISNNDAAKRYEVELVEKMAKDNRLTSCEYFSIKPNVAKGIKAIYYGVGKPRVER